MKEQGTVIGIPAETAELRGKTEPVWTDKGKYLHILPINQNTSSKVRLS